MPDPSDDQETPEVLVALSHVGVVSAVLRDLLDPVGAERSEPLGLSRLRLRNVADTARELGQRVANLPSDRQPPATQPKPADTAPLDQALWAIRQLVAAENGGWQPVIGKNRVVSLRIAGRLSHGVTSGGVGDPKAFSQHLDWSARAEGPGQGVRVGVLDTGLSPQPWLAGGWEARYSDRLRPDEEGQPSAGHATFVTGLVLSQAPGATVVVRQLLDAEDGKADSWSAAQQIVEFGRTGIDILNLSFTCFSEDGQPPMAIATAIDRLDPSIVVVAAAGNHGHLAGQRGLRPAWPAALDDVIAVGAALSPTELATFTPRRGAWIDVTAPGVDLISTFLSHRKTPAGPEGSHTYNGFARWSGSSFATALVSGQIAAGTRPGRVTARESWDNIFASVKGEKGLPPYLPLRVPGLTGPG